MSILTPKSIGLVSTRHPEWTKNVKDWEKWKLAYEGGKDFINSCLIPYSRRELHADYQLRRQITYNPAHSKQVLNKYRDAMMAKMHEIERTGDPLYLDLCTNDIDLKKNSMNSFVALEIMPLLMAQGRRYVIMDAHAVATGVTRDEDHGRPYIWAVGPEALVAWTRDDKDHINYCLIKEEAEITDPKTGFITSLQEQYRLMKLLQPNETYTIPKSKYTDSVTFTAGSTTEVIVRLLDRNSKDLIKPVLVPLPRLPLIEMTLVDALMKDIADIQICLLNLSSSDMNFLYRGNFPIFVKNVDLAKKMIKPRAVKKPASLLQEIELKDREADQEDRVEHAEHGMNKGVSYDKGLQAPGFIAPQVANVTTSMAKQEEMKQEIRVLLDQSLVSMSKKALQQSGESKLADRIGVEAGLAYIAGVCEVGERNISEIFHAFLGKSGTASKIKYPTDFSAKDMNERLEESKSLAEVSTSVRSESFQKEMAKRCVSILLKHEINPSLIDSINNEIDNSVWFDANLERSQIINADKAGGMVSGATGSVLRGYPKDEADKLAAESIATANALSGGEITTQQPEPALDSQGNPVAPIEPSNTPQDISQSTTLPSDLPSTPYTDGLGKV